MPTTLTPIKIPGKIKKDNSKAAIAARKALKRPKGRPLKPLLPPASVASTGFSPPVKKAKTRTLKNIKSKRKMSDLERLPVELLEKIFLFCMNLDLPRSSPVIGGKLSSEIIYSHTLINAFGPTWNKSFVQTLSSFLDEDPTGDPLLQSAVLRCRWASLTRILKAKETLIQKSAQGRKLKPRYFLRSNEELSEALIQQLAEDGEIKPPDLLDNHEQSSRIMDDMVLTRLSAQEFFEKDFKGFSIFAKQRDGPQIWQHCTWGFTFDVARGTEIPNTLLLGPWTEESIRYLFWVTKSGAQVDFIKTTSGEVALMGLKNAIIAGDTRVIHLLAWAGLISKFDIDTLLWAFRNSGGDKIATVNQLLRIGSATGMTNEDTNLTRVQKELGEMRDEAEHEGDEEKHGFVKELLNSQSLCGRLDIRM